MNANPEKDPRAPLNEPAALPSRPALSSALDAGHAQTMIEAGAFLQAPKENSRP